MTVGHHQTSATILPFPGRARMTGKAGFGSRPGDKPGDETKAPRIAHPSFTDSWYHQAAIDEAPNARKP